MDIGAPHISSHGQDGAVHITAYGSAKLHMESETKHVQGTQIHTAKDSDSNEIFSTDNTVRTLGFHQNATVDFNNCTVTNLAGGGGGGVPDPLNINNVNVANTLTTNSIEPLANDPAPLRIKANFVEAPASENLGVTCNDLTCTGTSSLATVIATASISAGTTMSATGAIIGGSIQSQSTLVSSGTLTANNGITVTQGNVTVGNNGSITCQGNLTSTFGNVDVNNAVIANNVACESITVDSGTQANRNISVPRVFFRAGAGGCNMSQPVAGGANENTLFIKQSGAGAGSGIVFLRDGGAEGTATDENLRVDNGGEVRARGGVYVPEVNFRQDGTGGWSINQGASGGAQADSLACLMPNANGTFNVLDEAGNPLLIQSKLGLISQTAMNQNANFTLASTSNLRFGGYIFTPTQYTLTRTLTIAANSDTTNFTNMAFNCQSDTWTVVNTGATGVSMYNALLEGVYKCVIEQTGSSSSGNFEFNTLVFDYVFRLSIQTDPDIIITEPAYGYRTKPTNQARPTIEIDHFNTPVQSQPVFVRYPNQSAGETMPITVRLTKMPY